MINTHWCDGDSSLAYNSSLIFRSRIRRGLYNDITCLHSPAILVSSSGVFRLLLDDYSAEILLLACLVQQPDYAPALSSYGKLAARKVRQRYHVVPTYGRRSITQVTARVRMVQPLRRSARVASRLFASRLSQCTGHQSGLINITCPYKPPPNSSYLEQIIGSHSR